MTKICTKCKIEKSIENYSKRKDSIDGLNHVCRHCKNKQMNKYRSNNREQINSRARQKYAIDPIIKEKKKAYKTSHPIKSRSSDTLTEIQLENRRIAKRKYDRLNPDKKNARRAKRRAAELQRTVPWANLKLIAKFYTLAKELTEKTGILYHVDHIIPLQGKTVSGFHIESNLQVIPAKFNLSKSNKYEYGESGLCPAGDYI